LVTKTKVVEGGTTPIAWLYYQPNQFTHVTGGFTVTSLSANLSTQDKCG